MTDQDKAASLLPCPFCGDNDVEPDCFDRNEASICTEPAGCCNGCGVIVKFDFEAEQPWAEIRRRWNTRAKLGAAVDEGMVAKAVEAAFVEETGGFGEHDNKMVGLMCARAAIAAMKATVREDVEKETRPQPRGRGNPWPDKTPVVRCMDCGSEAHWGDCAKDKP